MLDIVLSTLGAVAGPLAQIQGGREANAANAREGEINRQFQHDMSNTSHVREVQDLKNAGLNPLLSANAGASTPAGAMASFQNPMEGMANSAMSLATLAQNLKKGQKEIELLDAQKRKTLTDEHAARIGIPASDMINRMWNKVQEKLSGAMDWSAKEQKQNRDEFQEDVNKIVARQQRKRQRDAEAKKAYELYKERNNLP